VKVRIKFQKQGDLRFIGHLDVMRTFQKINRRAKLDVKYSMGFSPHQEMSFATPLGLGLTSTSEYADIEFNTVPHRQELIDLYNSVNVPELRVLDACLLPEKAKNAMSLLEAADYTISFREGCEPGDTEGFFEALEAFLARPEIHYMKESKTKNEEADLKSFLRLYERRGNAMFFRVDAGSRRNLRPELLLQAFYESRGEEYSFIHFNINRDELYGEEDGQLKRLCDYGEDF